jgi:PASTA domain
MYFFRAHRAVGTTIPTYFIESTAPYNVDDTVVVPAELPSVLRKIKPQEALQQIAETLAKATNPNLVVMVHGFNNPEPAVLKLYTSAAMAIERDAAVTSREGLVCVGYRWPSESMGQPRRGTWDALPTLPTWILYCGVILAALPFLLFYFAPDSSHWTIDIFRLARGRVADHLVTMAGLTLAGLVLTAALLRTIVYFRDTYRATNYGEPDLVQIIRAIDGKIGEIRGSSEYTNDVQLSFIGHSMGGFVVTNTIRVLSDVFAREVRDIEAYGAGPAGGDTPPPSPNIGRVFQLKRFVLASPDIPAETLLSSRGNFLASALARFEEAYLFSNEGDEVLRQISTLANYFVFPTNTRNHGFRLGNVEILSRNFGLIDVNESDFLRVLRIGHLTLQQLYDALEDAKASRQQDPAARVPAQAPLPKVFTYFDCTDYVDREADDKPARPLLTFARRRKRWNANAKLRWYSHLHLLFAYLVHHQRPNVHGGYFEGLLSQQLIYRLACLGYRDTVAAYGGEAQLSKACQDKQIRALVSPLLLGQRLAQTAPPPPDQANMRPASAPPQTPAPSIGVVVPDLVGLPIGDARARVVALRDIQVGPVALPVRGSESLLVLLEITRESPGKPLGTVVSQTPAAGSRVARGTSIEAVIAK